MIAPLTRGLAQDGHAAAPPHPRNTQGRRPRRRVFALLGASRPEVRGAGKVHPSARIMKLPVDGRYDVRGGGFVRGAIRRD